MNRTINSIVGYCRLLLDEELGELQQPQKRALGAMEECITRLRRIIDNLLDVTGRIDIEDHRVVVTLDKRAHNPYLVDCGLANQPTPMLWLEGKELVIEFA